MEEVFDECSWNSLFNHYQGGKTKELVITKGLTGVTRVALSFPHAPPLDQLIESLSDLFASSVDYNVKLSKQRKKALNKAPYEGPGSLQNITEPPNILKSDNVIKLFDDALASPGWPATRDVVADLIPQKPRYAAPSSSKLKRSSDFEGNSTAKSQRRSGAAEAGSSLRRQVLEE
ncbi:hypothetical protein NEOLEDRAFT_937403 [Neolentinus lepideus HHB14362 ss-1]|uniref:Uncharacterized protein n=1 Tax=Neolentinus lepideus HHB14362 ss-1 TaxID=1314782 RepID=A0A165NGY1_9AGAM|nr:hypothetical protein NEOLEDRAFT_937403 [Neolentinus lepideus HHB14362 ss-1]